MRTFLTSIVRAVCAAATGYLLVMYRTDMVHWLTIAVGGLFFISGLFSVVAYYADRRKARLTAERLKAVAELRDDHESPKDPDDIVRAMRPTFPIVGIGSIILGALLALMPTEFVKGTMYALAALLILGGINQLYNLFSVRRMASIPWLFWLFPLVIIGVGIFMVVRPLDLSTEQFAEAKALPFRILGYGLILYAVVELINGIQLFRIRRRIEAADPVPQLKDEAEIEEAEIVEE